MAKKGNSELMPELEKALKDCNNPMERVGLVRKLSELLEARSGELVLDDERGQLVVRLASGDREKVIQAFIDKYPQKSK